MDVVIKINCDNAAFGEEPGIEVARLLRRMAKDAEVHLEAEKYRDLNGNTVASLEVRP